MGDNTRALKGIGWPILFVACMAWIVWYFPRFILLAGYGNDNLNSSYQSAGIVDLAIAVLAIAAFFIGASKTSTTAGEGEVESYFDRVSLFLARVCMLLIVILVSVMFFEVVMRYVFEAPTLWANELSLWMAGFIFLLSGLYAMQQRSHIRIYLLYDMFPRWLQHIADVISTLLIAVFAGALVWGASKEASDKFFRWETFGTAFDPPIPATLKPMILIVIVFITIQAIVNLIVDWNKEAETHGIVDESEFEDMLAQSGQHQHEAGRHD
ncbi:TRAP-type mannitol/chloroaromatic compound transport system permease small subunit [Palleronia aestuarii]|uniref:TRAP transporter small permease protein n=1 Tax=Palleronia aestuarii TaxID=568105 RepID=A0A2W7P5V3_9RHOB|nr:TRAP transporter small permease [Palleronia aestuarii]PZX18792.1 TRAP-type mannitol/chloroaromatic compound transport system permease small subunit [Palleronia aestuarii]